MPKIDLATAPDSVGVVSLALFAALSAHRRHRRLGDAGGLVDLGVGLSRLPPGEWSSQRHGHSRADGAETPLRAGDAATIPKGTGNGHHVIDRSRADAVYLEIGSRHPDNGTACSDADMTSMDADGRFLRTDGTPGTCGRGPRSAGWGVPVIGRHDGVRFRGRCSINRLATGSSAHPRHRPRRTGDLARVTAQAGIAARDATASSAGLHRMVAAQRASCSEPAAARTG